MLPKAVQAAVEQADAYVAQLQGEPPVEPQAAAETPAPAVEAPQETIAAEPPKAPVVDEKTWQHKYQSLQGMFNAQVPQLHQQVKELQAQLQGLSAENAKLKATPPEAPKALITDADREAFGSDLIDVMRRAAAEEAAKFSATEAQLKAEIETLKSQLGQFGERQAMSARDVFFRELTSLVPDWETLNSDEGMLAWLAAVDPIYGVNRQAGLNAAVEAFNAQHAAQVFNAYKATLAPTKPAPVNELSRQVAPARSRSTQPQVTGSEKPVITSQQVSEFYDNWRRGNYTDEQAMQMENEINLAIAEGRIRP